MTDGTQTSLAKGPRGFATRVVEIAVGYLTVIGFLFYPIGLVVLSLQIWNTYSYSFSDALFVVSLAPITLAAAKVWDFLFWALIALGAALAINGAIVGRRRQENLASIVVQTLPEAERQEFLDQQEPLFKVIRLLCLSIAFCSLLAPIAFQLILIESWRIWVLYAAFVIFCCIGGLAAGLLGLLSGGRSVSGYWKAIAVACAFSILAGAALTGTASSSLPLVQFESDQEERRLLAHTIGYWYVFDGRGTLVAIPTADAGNVEFIHD